ncbi:MAG: DedA family protein [Dehalococcoidia bacterium]
MLNALSELVLRAIDSLGYVGFAFIVMAETIVPVIPSEVVLTLGGFAASRGQFTLGTTIAVATVASVVGALALYGIAAFFGPEPLHILVRRYGRWAHVSERDLEAAERWFARWSVLAVAACRCLPVLRVLISIPAGFERMSLMSFTASTAAGSLLWNTVFVTAGFLLGEQWETVLHYAQYFQYAAIALMILGLAYLAMRIARRRSA